VDHIVPPPGFETVNLTVEDEDMDDTPASPSPNVSDDMDTDEEEDLLAYHGLQYDSSSDEDGFQHV